MDRIRYSCTNTSLYPLPAIAQLGVSIEAHGEQRPDQQKTRPESQNELRIAQPKQRDQHSNYSENGAVNDRDPPRTIELVPTVT